MKNEPTFHRRRQKFSPQQLQNGGRGTAQEEANGTGAGPISLPQCPSQGPAKIYSDLHTLTKKYIYTFDQKTPTPKISLALMR